MIFVLIEIIIFIVAVAVFLFPSGTNKRKQIEEVTDYSRGEWSERQLIPVLINKCGIDPRAIFHDLYLLKSDGTYTQIDLAVASPQGIIVVEVKDYSGWIFGDEQSKYWMQVLAFGKEKHQFYNPIKQNESHIAALRKLLPNNPNVEVFNVVVFCGTCEFKELRYNLSGRTRVIYDFDFASVVNSIKELEPAHYGNKREVADVLATGVFNGNFPEVREAQKNVARKAKYRGNEYHSYSSHWHFWFR